MKKERRAAPFFGLHDRMPVLLALLLGFQHALSMLAGWLIHICSFEVYKLMIARCHHAAHYSGKCCQSHTGPTAISCFYLLDCLRIFVIDSDHALSYLGYSILHWHWLDLCCWNIVCYNPGCNWCAQSNVRYRLLPNEKWRQTPLPRWIRCHSWYSCMLCAT